MRAIPPPEAPRGLPTVSPTPLPPTARVLPYGSSLQFVLDDLLDSANAPAGSVIHVHLREPLVLNGRTVAPAGTATTMTIIAATPAQSGDVDGAVQIHVNPLPFPDGALLPVRAPHQFLAIDRSTGELSTRDVNDSIGDVFVPGYFVYQIFRKGRNFKLRPGSVFSVYTDASVNASNPNVVTISTPPPFVLNHDMPHSDLTPVPLYTVPPTLPPQRRGKPAATPTPAPVPTSTPAAAASPAPATSTPTGSP